MSNLESYAEDEMRRAGLYDQDADYGVINPETGETIEECALDVDTVRDGVGVRRRLAPPVLDWSIR
jgi:hypothetical protein